MKFLVDEMPYWHTECPFFDLSTHACKCTPYEEHCDYFDAPAGERCAEACTHLKEIAEDKLEAAEECIIEIEDALDRGADNDRAREAIEKYEKRRTGNEQRGL